MVVDPCEVITAACNTAALQDPLTQRLVLIRLLCAAATALGASVTCTDAALKAASQAYWCQGSSAKLRLIQAQTVCNGLDVDCTQAVCWTPLELEGALAYLTCKIVNALNPPIR